MDTEYVIIFSQRMSSLLTMSSLLMNFQNMIKVLFHSQAFDIRKDT